MIGVVTNADIRISSSFYDCELVLRPSWFQGSVIADLNLATYLDIILISEEEGVEKPAKDIWERACARVHVHPSEACHIGDELMWYVFPT